MPDTPVAFEWDKDLARVLFEAVKQGVLVCRKDSTILAANTALVDWLGVRSDDSLIAMSAAKLLSMDRAEWSAAWSTAKSGSPYVCVKQVHSPTGMSFLAECTMTPAGTESLILTVLPHHSDEVDLDAPLPKLLDSIPAKLVVRALEYKQMFLAEEKVARTDAVTGLCNRCAFDEALETALEAGAIKGTSCGVVVLLMHPHQQEDDLPCDEVMRKAGLIARRSVRQHDTIARTSLFEFAAILPSTGPETTIEIAERLLQAMGSFLSQQDASLSAGVSSTTDGPQELGIFERARIAAHQAALMKTVTFDPTRPIRKQSA